MSNDSAIRCPKLGGEVTFSYCEKERGDFPCQRIIVCWQPYFPVESYLKGKLSSGEWDECFNLEPKDKLTNIIELIEAAKKRRGLSD